MRRDYGDASDESLYTILRGTRVVVLSWHGWNDGGRWVETEISEMPKSPDHDKEKRLSRLEQRAAE